MLHFQATHLEVMWCK